MMMSVNSDLPNGTIVGHAQRASWYQTPDGGVYSVHVAKYDDNYVYTFAVDNKTWPSLVLDNELANYIYLRNATHEEAMAYWASKNVTDIKRIEV